MRIATPHAGNGRGMLFLPEVGDEVVVAFEQGDPERPCVMGSVWNGRDRAPHQSGVQRIVTRSGNALHLSDEQGKETVEIHTAKGTCLIQLSNDAGGVPTITLHVEGDLALEATGEIRMSCKRFVQKVAEDSASEIGGGEQLRIGKGLKVTTERELVLVAGTNASFQAGARLETVAGAVNTVAGAQVQIQPPGHVKQQISIGRVVLRDSVHGSRPVPALAPGTSTADTRTPRAGGQQPPSTPAPAAAPREPLRVTSVRASSESARVGDTVVYRAGTFNRPPEGSEASAVRWALQIDGGPVTTLSQTGAELQFRIAAEHDGKLLRMHAFMQSPAPRVSATTQIGNVRRLIWVQAIPAAEREAFRAKVLAVSASLGVDPDYLMACMAFETGATFSPGQRNHAGSGAVGLIQFMPSTARGLGTTAPALARMTRVQQMDYVERYFRGQMRGRSLRTIEDVYMAILYPAAIGRPNDHVLFRRTADCTQDERARRTAYCQNRGLDHADRDGLITKGEAAAAVRRKYQEGQALRG
jgi:phage baseplate assembly protein gpV